MKDEFVINSLWLHFRYIECIPIKKVQFYSADLLTDNTKNDIEDILSLPVQ